MPDSLRFRASQTMFRACSWVGAIYKTLRPVLKSDFRTFNLLIEATALKLRFSTSKRVLPPFLPALTILNRAGDWTISLCLSCRLGIGYLIKDRIKSYF